MLFDEGKSKLMSTMEKNSLKHHISVSIDVPVDDEYYQLTAVRPYRILPEYHGKALYKGNNPDIPKNVLYDIYVEGIYHENTDLTLPPDERQEAYYRVHYAKEEGNWANKAPFNYTKLDVLNNDWQRVWSVYTLSINNGEYSFVINERTRDDLIKAINDKKSGFITFRCMDVTQSLVCLNINNIDEFDFIPTFTTEVY